MRASIRPSKAERHERHETKKPAHDLHNNPPRDAPRATPHRRPHPKTDGELKMRELQHRVATEKRRVSSRVRRWLSGFVADGCKDPVASANRLGFSRPERCWDWASKYGDLLEMENLRATMGRQMELAEALERVADLARTTEDAKVKHSALRTVLEVHGALSAKALPPGDRKTVVRELEEMVGRIKNLAAAAGKGGLKVTAGVSVTVEDVEKTTEIAPQTVETVEMVPSAAVSISSEKAVDKGPEANIGVKTE